MIISASSPQDLRDAIRYGASCDISIDAIGDDVYPSVLMDISASGFRAMVDGSVATGASITLRIGSWPGLGGIVVWQRGSVIGCEFSERLERAALLSILRRHCPQSWSDPAIYLGNASLGK